MPYWSQSAVASPVDIPLSHALRVYRMRVWQLLLSCITLQTHNGGSKLAA